MPQPLLKNPFIVDWQQQTSGENSVKVLEVLTESLGNIRPRAIRIAKSEEFDEEKKKKWKKSAKSKNDVEPKVKVERLEENSYLDKEQKEKSKKVTDNVVRSESRNIMDKTNFTKKYFVFGTSQVVRELEYKRLSVAIFDPNLLKQPAIAQHVGSLCVNSGAFCCQLENLSDKLSPILNIVRVAAVGIRLHIETDEEKPDENLSIIIETIKRRLKSVVLGDAVENTERKKSIIVQNLSIFDNREVDQPISHDYVTPSVVYPTVSGDKKRSKKRKNKNVVIKKAKLNK